MAEIADYEVRRELLRARKRRGVERLNQLKADFGYVAITTATMLQASAYWAQLRQQGMPTAPDLGIDGDVILAAQAALLIGLGHNVVIATTNVGHLARLVSAEEWHKITRCGGIRMQPAFLEALGLFQWLGFALLVVAWPVYEVLKLRRRVRQAEDRAVQLIQQPN